MTREEFWDWMATCPMKENGENEGWLIADDGGTDVRIFFYFDIDEESEDDK